MNTWKIYPKDINIAKYVECYWFLEREASDEVNTQPRLNPDPAAHMIIIDAAQCFYYKHDFIVQKGIGSHWIYPHRKTFVMDHSKPFRMVGIKFNIAALYGLDLGRCDQSLDKIENIDLDTISLKFLPTADSILSSAVANKHIARDLLDSLLAAWLKKGQDDRHSELTRKVLPLLTTTPIPKIGELLHRSQRTIERSFLRTTHLTLKQCKSMIRLEALLDWLYKADPKDVNWSDIANQFEFSDQPHLIRYLIGSIGATPTDYAATRDLTIDVYGDFELT